ncbi:YwdI family protein [Bacillus sp. CGMCC 1.16607]|uniref:YwdI family protein n=1 Tax=Bacillus sp. CGMCC 1.16607 TaxID=3351842 RepID=UPI00364292AA
MSISISHLLRKMESELFKAKQEENISKVRENIHSIKILCELLLEENDTSVNRKDVVFSTEQISQVVSSPSLTSKKLEMDEEANGESLFDF